MYFEAKNGLGDRIIPGEGSTVEYEATEFVVKNKDGNLSFRLDKNIWKLYRET